MWQALQTELELNTPEDTQVLKEVKDYEFKVKEAQIKQEALNKIKTDADILSTSLDKKREKIGDADIPDNIQIREHQYEELKIKVAELEKTLEDLQQTAHEKGEKNVQIMKMESEVKKASGKVETFRDKDLDTFRRDIDAVQIKTDKLDLERADGKDVAPIIDEVRQIGAEMDKFDQNLEKFEKEVENLQKKLNGLNAMDQLDDYRERVKKQREDLDDMTDDLAVIEEVADEL